MVPYSLERRKWLFVFIVFTAILTLSETLLSAAYATRRGKARQEGTVARFDTFRLRQ